VAGAAGRILETRNQ